jgi:acyl-CoA synthetase (AMP-forming)/AMP-acid ligase II
VSRIVITSVGYLGDIAPYIEPARQLTRAGHDVLFVAPAGYRALLASEPFVFAEYPGGDLSAAGMHADPRHEALMRHPTLNAPRLARYYINGYFLRDPERVANEWKSLLAGAEAVLTHIAPAPVVVPIAKHLGVKTVVGTVVPMIIPTAHRMATFVPGPRSLGRLCNRLSWLQADLALHATYAGPALNRLRVQCGLPKTLAPGAHGHRDADRLVAIVPERFAGPAFDDWPPLVWATQTASFKIGPNTQVFDEDSQKVAPGSGVMGMVAVADTVPMGYYKDPEKSARTVRSIDGLWWTFPGDFAMVEADGTITLLGRGSQVINTAGEKVFAEEVEETLKTHPNVDDCLVVGLPDERFGQLVTALVSLVPGTSIDHATLEGELVSHAKARLASYKAPRRIVVVESVPRAANGKADYATAKAMAQLADAE